jgi:hypothetical protein
MLVWRALVNSKPKASAWCAACRWNVREMRTLFTYSPSASQACSYTSPSIGPSLTVRSQSYSHDPPPRHNRRGRSHKADALKAAPAKGMYPSISQNLRSTTAGRRANDFWGAGVGGTGPPPPMHERQQMRAEQIDDKQITSARLFVW